MGLSGRAMAGGDAERLERAVIGYLVNARAELDRQAGALEADLEALALTGADAAAFAARSPRFLGRAVAVEGTAGEVLAVHAPPEPAGAARDAARYCRPGEAVSRGARRSPGAAAVALLGADPVTERELVDRPPRIAPLLALALGHGRMASESAAAAGAGPPRGRSALGRADGPPGACPGEAEPRADREALRLRLRRLRRRAGWQLRGDADSLELRLVVAPDAGRRRWRSSSLAARGRGGGRLVAVSRPFLAPEARALAEQEARATLEAAEALRDPACWRPARRCASPAPSAWPRTGSLGNLHNLPDGHRRRPRPAGAAAGRAAASAEAERLATLRASSTTPGLVAAAASPGHPPQHAGLPGAPSWSVSPAGSSTTRICASRWALPSD